MKTFMLETKTARHIVLANNAEDATFMFCLTVEEDVHSDKVTEVVYGSVHTFEMGVYRQIRHDEI